MDAIPSRTAIRPQPGPQETFLSTVSDIAIYGGAAGGGKTWSLLYEPLRHVANPDFGAVVFRRTSPQIYNEGGLWDEASRLYPLVGAVPLVGENQWRFPAGSKVTMRHLQHETTKFDWQGSQVPLIEFDELTHFSESQFFYMFSRNRSTCGVRPYIRGSTNPDAGSWVKGFLAPWVMRGYPLRAESGEVLYFCRVDGKVVWARTRAQLALAYGPECEPKSCTFVRSSIFDNAILLAKDPGYLANLKALPAVEQARLLHGDWDVVAEGLVYPDLARACEFDPATVPIPDGTRYGGIDWGFNNPFAALVATLDRDDVLWVHRERYRSRTTLGEHARAVPGDVHYFADPAGADQIAEFQAAGHDVTPCVHLGQEALMNGIDAVTSRIKGGRLRVSRACAHLLAEAGKYRFPDDARARTAAAREKPLDCDNHALGALRYMVVGIDRFQAVRGGAMTARRAAEAAEETARLEAERRAHEDEHRDPDNELWWRG